MKLFIKKAMHHIILFTLLLFIFAQVRAQHTTIRQNKACINCPNPNPEPSAVLEVQSTNKGILIPRVVNTAAINNPATGLMIYDNLTDDFKYYDGFNWQSMGLKHIDFPGLSNTFVGIDAGTSNTAGNYNTANGYYALKHNTTGNSNVGMGICALHSNTHCSNLVAVGDSTLYNNGMGATSSTHGIANTAVGSKALHTNTTGSFNTATGKHALYFNSEGLGNTATGVDALYNNSTGINNTATGNYALSNNTTGSKNTALGFGAFSNIGTTNYSNSTAIGFFAQPTGSNEVCIGNIEVTQIGGYTNWSNVSDARFKKQIQNDVPGLAFIRQLRPVTYQMDMDAIAKFHQTPDSLRLAKSEKTKTAIRYTGFLAQDVEKAAESIGYNFSGIDKPQHDKDNYSLRYAEFVVPLVKAVQELSKENELLKAELKQKDAAFEARLERLEVELQ